MLKTLRHRSLVAGLLPSLVLGIASWASAQAIPSATPLTFNPNGPFVPNVPVFNGMPMQGMTQQQASQMQNIMMLRALQMHGHHRPHTGVPNPIINNGPGGGYPSGMPTTQAAPSTGTKASYGKSRDEKKEELRRKKEEKKLAAKAAGKVKNKATAAEKKLAREKQQADAKL